MLYRTGYVYDLAMAVSNLQSCCTGSRSMHSANYVIHIAEYNDQFIFYFYIITLLPMFQFGIISVCQYPWTLM